MLGFVLLLLKYPGRQPTEPALKSAANTVMNMSRHNCSACRQDGMSLALQRCKDHSLRSGSCHSLLRTSQTSAALHTAAPLLRSCAHPTHYSLLFTTQRNRLVITRGLTMSLWVSKITTPLRLGHVLRVRTTV